MKKRIAELMLQVGVIAFLILAPYSGKLTKRLALFILISYLLNYFLTPKDIRLRIPPLRSFLNKGIFLFLFFAFISTVFSISPYHSQSILFERYLPYILCLYLGMNFIRLDFKNIRVFEIAWLISGIIFGVGGLFYFFKHFPNRLFYSWNINVDIAGFSTLMVPFSFIYFLKHSKYKVRALAGLSTVLVTLCLLFNYSRGALISIFIGILVTICLQRRDRKEALFLLTLVLLCVLFLFLFQPLHFFDLSTWEGRIYYMREAIKIFETSPFIGKGLGAYELCNIVNPKVGHILHVENIFLEILAESGLLGLACFLYLFWRYFRRILLNRGERKVYQFAIGASILSTFISGIFGAVILVGISNSFLLWFILGISVGEVN